MISCNSLESGGCDTIEVFTGELAMLMFADWICRQKAQKLLHIMAWLCGLPNIHCFRVFLWLKAPYFSLARPLNGTMAFKMVVAVWFWSVPAYVRFYILESLCYHLKPQYDPDSHSKLEWNYINICVALQCVWLANWKAK